MQHVGYRRWPEERGELSENREEEDRDDARRARSVWLGGTGVSPWTVTICVSCCIVSDSGFQSVWLPYLRRGGGGVRSKVIQNIAL